MFSFVKAMISKETPNNSRLVELIKQESSVRVVGRGTVVRDVNATINTREFQELSSRLAKLVR